MPKDRTQNNLENNLDGFERVLRALILAGMDPKEAVKVAYHRYPVMRHLYKDLLDDLVGDFAEGYGKKKAAAKFEREAISAAMNKSWTDDGVNLSERMYKNSKKVQAESAEVIGKAIKEGESAAKTAKKLFDGYGKGGIIPEQDIPEFIQEVKDLPVPDWLDEEAVAEWKAAIRHARKLIEQGTTPGLRAAYSEVMDAIENGAKQNVSKAIDTAVQEKTRYTAERIARTERARAYADGVMAKYMDDPDIVAFQWKLSDRHPKCDICDVYAHADLYGLGKGIFPKDKFPKLPAHPHCLCRIKPIVDGMIDMSRQKDNIDKGGKAYIKTLPKREQERVLGVHGRKDVMGGKKEWYTSARGVSGEGFKARVPKDSRGAISGAINDASLDKNERDKAKTHAKMYYETLRNSDREILIGKITVSSGFRRESIEKVLEHVFDNKYNLDEGYGHFEPDFQMAQLFQRLLEGNPVPRDITLLKHERLEYELMNRYGYTDYEEAHRITERKYNYNKALQEEGYNDFSKKNTFK